MRVFVPPPHMRKPPYDDSSVASELPRRDRWPRCGIARASPTDVRRIHHLDWPSSTLTSAGALAFFCFPFSARVKPRACNNSTLEESPLRRRRGIVFCVPRREAVSQHVVHGNSRPPVTLMPPARMRYQARLRPVIFCSSRTITGCAPSGVQPQVLRNGAIIGERFRELPRYSQVFQASRAGTVCPSA